MFDDDLDKNSGCLFPFGGDLFLFFLMLMGDDRSRKVTGYDEEEEKEENKYTNELNE